MVAGSFPVSCLDLLGVDGVDELFGGKVRMLLQNGVDSMPAVPVHIPLHVMQVEVAFCHHEMKSTHIEVLKQAKRMLQDQLQKLLLLTFSSVTPLPAFEQNRRFCMLYRLPRSISFLVPFARPQI